MVKFSRPVLAFPPILLAVVALMAAVPSTQAQDFTLQVQAPFNPPSLEPGSGSAVATVSLTPLNGFTGSVSLSCSVTPVQATSPPTCTVSPLSVTPSGSSSVTFSTSSSTPSGSYVATVTGMGGTTTAQVTLNIAVLTVTPGYTLTVSQAVTPSSVHAGSGATATLAVTPVNGYTGSVTISCSAISPAVTPAPVCAFSPNPVVISGPAAQTSTLTITTTGTTGSIARARIFYAAWLPLPLFLSVAMGLVPSGNLRRRFLGLLLLCALAIGLTFLPACGSNSSTSTTSGNVTPKNTYTFTLNGSDTNSMAPSNGTQTVSLTVN